MRTLRWPVLLVMLFTIGCVKQTEFDTYRADMDTWKASVQKSGNDVDAWMAQAQKVLEWVSANGAKFTCSPACSDPPPAPTPLPDGQW